MRNTRKREWATGFGCVLTVLVLATGNGCSSSGDDDDDDSSSGAGGSGGSAASNGGTGAKGGTDGNPDLCGTAKCPAGQYCVAGTTCTPGCLTDADCGGNGDCADIDDVTHVGTCKEGPVKDCPGYLTKCEACAGGELCTQRVCDGLSAECVNCVAKANCDDSGGCPCD